MIYFFFN